MHRLLCYFVNRKIDDWRQNPVDVQKKVFRKMLKKLSRSEFGREHALHSKMSIEEFQEAVPIYHYEDFSLKYFSRLQNADPNVLWPGKLKCFCISSGTTSAEKLIPVYSEALFTNVKSAFMASYVFMKESKNYDLFTKKIFHLYGLSRKENKNGILYGYIGYLSNSLVPEWLVKNKYPPRKFDNVGTWQEKIQAIVDDIDGKDLSVISGTPPWVNNFLKELAEKDPKSVMEKFPNLKLYIHGGTPFERYRQTFINYVKPNKNLWTQEFYPASEGFLAFQDHWDENDRMAPMDMLLNIGENIFFEFLEYKDGQIITEKRYTVENVKVGKVYTLLTTTIGSFISYIIGDNVQVTSKKPFRIKFIGRAKQNINLVNEHMDFRTLENIFRLLNEEASDLLKDYIILPMIEEGNAFYHWFISTSLKDEIDREKLIESIKVNSSRANPFYAQWRKAGVLKPEKLTIVDEDAFLNFYKGKKSVGQNKIPTVIQDQAAQVDFLSHFSQKL